MKRFSTIVATMVLAASCGTMTENKVIDLQSQQIGITSAHNARQLGGYIIGDRQIKKDLLLRTAGLFSLSAADSSLLADKFKVQCIYDFRSSEEAQNAPDVIPGNARYVSLSIAFGDSSSSSKFGNLSQEEMIQMLLQYADNPMIQDMCEHMYDKIFLEESSQEVYRRFFADLIALAPEDGAVLWHCTQGKDRAGSASAMLLAALGADRELIMTDFTLSKKYYDPHLASINIETENQHKVIYTLISANPDVFASTLDKVEAQYGSLQNYLTECIGVTSEMMEILQERYLEPRNSK